MSNKRLEAMANHADFHRVMEHLIDRMRTQINRVPQKGDKEEECQHLTLLNALNGVDMAVNGTRIEDFID